MTRLLIAFDDSEAARSAIAGAAALFEGAEAVVATVQPPPPSLEAARVARAALPDAMIRDGVERMQAEAREQAAAIVDAGVELAEAGGLRATSTVLGGLSAWRTLRDAARSFDVLVCGTRGQGPVGRALLGSTASSLVHHLETPLLIVPAGAGPLDGPVVAGYDGSAGARAALDFAAAHLPSHPLVVASAWASPVRHSLRGHALQHSRVEMLSDYADMVDAIYRETAEDSAREGADHAASLGLTAEARIYESGRGDWQTLLRGATDDGAAALLVGSRGRGAAAATVLGSVTSGLVHAAALPVLVVPDAV